jgi:hypothetical protein
VIALLRKDARLSLDALRPWSLCCLVALLAVGALFLLPADLRMQLFGQSPESPHSDDSAEAALLARSALRFIADAIAWTAIPLALFLGAAVGLGDRLHGARLLAEVLPQRRSARIASVLIVTLVAALLPPAVMLAIAILARRPTLGTEIPALVPLASLASAGLALGLSLCAAGSGSPFRSRAKLHRWHCVLIGALILGIGFLLGGVAGRGFLPGTDPSLHQAIVQVDESAALQETYGTGTGDRIRSAAFFGGGVAGTIAIGVAGWCAAAVVLGGFGRRSALVAMGAAACGAIALPLVAGAVGGAVVAQRSNAAWRLQGFAYERIGAIDRHELAAMLASNRERFLSSMSPVVRYENGPKLFGPLLAYPEETLRVALETIDDEPGRYGADDPLRMKLAELQSIETPLLAAWTLLWTRQSDPSHLRLALLAAERFADEPVGHMQLLSRLRRAVFVMHPFEEVTVRQDRVIAFVLPALESLATDPPGTLPPEIEAEFTMPSGQRFPLPRVDAATRAEINRLLPVFRERAKRVDQVEMPANDTPPDSAPRLHDEGGER